MSFRCKVDARYKVYATENKKNLQKFLDEYTSETTSNPLNSNSRIWKNKVTSEIHIQHDRIWLKDIKSLDIKKGFASQFMTWFCNLADKYQVGLVLDPVPYDKNISKRDLIRFYNKFQFVSKGNRMFRDTVAIIKLGNTWKVINTNE